MKKTMVILGLLILTSSVMAALPGVGTYGQGLVNARRRGQQSDSAAKLKQIGLAIMMHAMENDEKMPGSFTELTARYLNNDTGIFIAADDRVSKRAAAGKPITGRNTSFAYLGKSLQLNQLRNPSAIPAAFEKPQLFPAKRALTVLYADGHVAAVNVPAAYRKNSRTMADFLTSKLDKKLRNTLLNNAAQADK